MTADDQGVIPEAPGDIVHHLNGSYFILTAHLQAKEDYDLTQDGPLRVFFQRFFRCQAALGETNEYRESHHLVL